MEYLATVPCITIETINHIEEYDSSFSRNMAKTPLRRAVKMLLEGRPLMAPPYLSDEYRPFNNLEQLMLNDRSHVNYHIMEAIRQMIRETSAPGYMLSEGEVFFLFNRAYAIVAHAMKNIHPELHLQKYIFADDAHCSTQSEVDLLLFRLKLPMAYCILKSIRHYIGGGVFGKYDRLFEDMERFLDNELPRRLFQLMNISTEVLHENENENSIEYWKSQLAKKDDTELDVDKERNASQEPEQDMKSTEDTEITDSTESTNNQNTTEKRGKGRATHHLFKADVTQGLSELFTEQITSALDNITFKQDSERRQIIYAELRSFAIDHREHLLKASKASFVRFLTSECRLLPADDKGNNIKNYENEVEDYVSKINKFIPKDK